MYLVNIIIIISFKEDVKRSLLELQLDLKSPELELEFLELSLELKLILSCGIGVVKNEIGIGIEMRKINRAWPKSSQNLISFDGGQDTSACIISGHSFHVFSRKPQN